MKKSTFKQISSAFLILFLFLGSCSKDSDSPFYVKFKLDGKEKKYDQPTLATVGLNGTPRGYGVFGKQPAGGNIYESLNVVITMSNDFDYIKDGITYTKPEARLFYTDEKNIKNSSVIISQSPVAITITLRNDKVIKGTFSGTVTNTIDSTKTYVITEGEFCVSL